MGNSSSRPALKRVLPKKVIDIESNLTKLPKLRGSLPSNSEAFSRDRRDPNLKVDIQESEDNAQLFKNLQKLNDPQVSTPSKNAPKKHDEILSILRNRKIIEEEDFDENRSSKHHTVPKIQNTSLSLIDLNEMIKKGHLNPEDWSSKDLANNYKIPEPLVSNLLKHLKPCERTKVDQE